jgi:hypothetical protein
MGVDNELPREVREALLLAIGATCGTYRADEILREIAPVVERHTAELRAQVERLRSRVATPDADNFMRVVQNGEMAEEVERLRAELAAGEVEYGIALAVQVGHAEVKPWDDLEAMRRRLASLPESFVGVQRRVTAWTPVEDEAGA